ncbi:MAG: 2-C-methyl-D-erythritol 4-phosphate cytidylyltransferase [Muribaculaceae bacterium]|nr:2-C-methyl-D-erythritol 4-phosphate cytidylyltransferase [Muribaculaceae bacterium]
MRKYAVIVAGGSGSRMGGGIPKQFRSLCGRPVLWWSMKAFKEEDPDTRLVLVLPEEFISLWKDFYSTLPESERYEYEIAKGGKTRGESVKNGLSLVEEDTYVAIHDGARPLVSPATISSGWEKVKEEAAAIPVVSVTDSLRFLVNNTDSESVNRDSYVAVQTPQMFKTSLLKNAYDIAGDRVFTDDAAVMENAGHKVSLYPGSYDNIKITNPKDMAIATLLMGKDA